MKIPVLPTREELADAHAPMLEEHLDRIRVRVGVLHNRWYLPKYAGLHVVYMTRSQYRALSALMEGVRFIWSAIGRRESWVCELAELS